MFYLLTTGDHQQQKVLAYALLLLGLIDVPIVHYAVNWWHTLHQGSTVFAGHQAIDVQMARPLYFMIFNFVVICVVIGSFRFTQLSERRVHDRSILTYVVVTGAICVVITLLFTWSLMNIWQKKRLIGIVFGLITSSNVVYLKHDGSRINVYLTPSELKTANTSHLMKVSHWWPRQSGIRTLDR